MVIIPFNQFKPAFDIKSNFTQGIAGHKEPNCVELEGSTSNETVLKECRGYSRSDQERLMSKLRAEVEDWVM